ncbi:MAG: tetratricopeptide repeat protein [Acidobacteriia bacterium]|nr:tetratricopeptide repeat protein [Terriglobia bacterium]
MFTWNSADHSSEENHLWLFARAIEWADWPLFALQSVAPFLLLVLPVYVVIVAIVCLNCLWWLIRYRTMSLLLVDLGVILIRIKWICCIGLSVYDLMRGWYATAVITALWPVLTFLIGLVLPSKADYGRLRDLILRDLVTREVLNLAQEKGESTEESNNKGAFNILASLPEWDKVPSSIVEVIAHRIGSARNARELINICRGSGILEKMALILKEKADDVEWACGLVSGVVLGGFAISLGKQGDLKTAKSLIEFAVLIKPNDVTSWYRLALINAQLGNYQAAEHWADKVLAFKPNAEGNDLWEKAMASATSHTHEEEEETAVLFGDPNIVGSWEKMMKATRILKETCRNQ